MNKYTTVVEFLDGLDADKRAQVDLLRSIISDAHQGLEEHIKWNASSFVLDGEDRVTFNLQNKDGIVQLVLHMGATKAENKKGAPIMPDDDGFITWQSDIRGLMPFTGLSDIQSRQSAVKDVIARWLAIS